MSFMVYCIDHVSAQEVQQAENVSAQEAQQAENVSTQEAQQAVSVSAQEIREAEVREIRARNNAVFQEERYYALADKVRTDSERYGETYKYTQEYRLKGVAASFQVLRDQALKDHQEAAVNLAKLTNEPVRNLRELHPSTFYDLEDS